MVTKLQSHHLPPKYWTSYMNDPNHCSVQSYTSESAKIRANMAKKRLTAVMLCNLMEFQIMHSKKEKKKLSTVCERCNLMPCIKSCNIYDWLLSIIDCLLHSLDSFTFFLSFKSLHTFEDQFNDGSFALTNCLFMVQLESRLDKHTCSIAVYAQTRYYITESELFKIRSIWYIYEFFILCPRGTMTAATLNIYHVITQTNNLH